MITIIFWDIIQFVSDMLSIVDRHTLVMVASGAVLYQVYG